MRSPTLTLCTLMVAGLLSPAPAVAQDAEEAEFFSSENMSHVDNISYELAYPEVEDLPYGTDIEFADLTSGAAGDFARLAGPGRVTTAVEVSKDTFASADTVLIATGGVYADALAAAPLAVSLDAPVLLSTADALSPETLAEIQRLGAAQAILLGGTEALDDAVVSDLEGADITVDRIGGANRYGTAALIAQRLGVGGEVLITEGERVDPDEGWQAALGASALGATHAVPLLLVNATRLPEETSALLSDQVSVSLFGNESDVTPDVAAEIDQVAGEVTRLGGETVFDTSALIAAESIRRGADPHNIYVATGRAFPDGLVSGAAVGTTGGVLFLVDGLGLSGSPETLTAIEQAGPTRLRIVGGTAAVNQQAGDALEALLPEGGQERQYAIAGTEFNGMQIVDITDPENAEVTSVYDCGVLQGDVQVFEQGDRTFATYTSENTRSVVVESRCVQDAVAAGDIVFVDETGGGPDGDQPDEVPDSKEPAYGTYVVELTNPLDPVYGGFIPVIEGSHNGTVDPTGNYFYNSDSALITDVTPQIQIYDISDLGDVQRIAEIDLPVRPGLGTSSHDITFNADGTRMYSAALSQTIIFDTTDPAAPVEISSFIDPAINLEHQADPITVTDSAGTQRDLLIVEDELAGAAGNGFCPGGGMHIYDVTGDNELNPMSNKVGTYFIPAFRPAGTGSGEGEALTCTAHVFRIYPDQQIITIAWYNAGVWVLDISGLADNATLPTDMPITTLGFAYFANSDTWSFKTNRFEEDGSFYGYGNDIARGMDIYRFDANTTPATQLLQGTWANQPTSIAMARQAASSTGVTPGQQVLPRCLIFPGA